MSLLLVFRRLLSTPVHSSDQSAQSDLCVCVACGRAHTYIQWSGHAAEELIKNNWVAIDANLKNPDVMGALARNMTRYEFNDVVSASFGLVQTAGIVISCYVFLAMFAANFAAKNPMKSGGLLSDTVDAAAVGGAVSVGGKIMTVVTNPMLGGGGDEADD